MICSYTIVQEVEMKMAFLKPFPLGILVLRVDLFHFVMLLLNMLLCQFLKLILQSYNCSHHDNNFVRNIKLEM